MSEASARLRWSYRRPKLFTKIYLLIRRQAREARADQVRSYAPLFRRMRTASTRPRPDSNTPRAVLHTVAPATTKRVPSCSRSTHRLYQ